MKEGITSKKLQTIVGISLVAVFIVSSVVTGVQGLSVTKKASAAVGYGGDTNNDNGEGRSARERRADERKRNKKHKKVSKKTVEKKVEEFKSFNAPRHQAAYRTVSAIKKASPARFRAMQNVFNRYNTVSGRLRVQPNAQTLAAINQYRSYDGYAKYLNYAAKLK